MELKKSCSTKATEYEERKKYRAMELVAIAETIKILNDDDALDLFKKTLPSPSFMQIAQRDRDLRAQVRAGNEICFPLLRRLEVSGRQDNGSPFSSVECRRHL